MTNRRALDDILAGLPAETALVIAAMVEPAHAVRTRRLADRDTALRAAAALLPPGTPCALACALASELTAYAACASWRAYRDAQALPHDAKPMHTLMHEALRLNNGRPLGWRQLLNILRGERTPFAIFSDGNCKGDLADARAANADEIDRLEAARPGVLLTGTSAEIDKTDENLRRRRIFAEQLDLLDPELRRLFTEAEQQEQDAAFDSALAEIRVAEAAWNARVQAEYPALAAALADLMAAEVTLRNSYATLTSLPAAGRKLHRHSITMHDLTVGMRRVKLGPAFSASHLADIVKVPALAPPAGDVGR